MTEETLKLTPEMLVPRLGEHLVRRGHISEEDLKKTLRYQQEKISRGEKALIGQTLLELGIITKETLDQAVTEQIIQLRSALQATNRNLEQRVQGRTADLQSALEKLSDLSELKANFISTISHELRTPLTHIKGFFCHGFALSLDRHVLATTLCTAALPTWGIGWKRRILFLLLSLSTKAFPRVHLNLHRKSNIR